MKVIRLWLLTILAIVGVLLFTFCILGPLAAFGE